jgi:hypothetical protein
MARPTLMKLALVIALTIAAGTAYGASQISNTTAVGASSFSPSNNVTIGVASVVTEYSTNAKHLNGDRVIAIYSGDPKIYYSSGAQTGSTVAAPAASNTYSNLSTTSGWNSM